MLTPASSIALIGFGEVCQRIAVPLARRGVALRAHDLLLHANDAGNPMRARIEAAGVDPAGTLEEALRGARLVIAAVGNASSSALVRSVAPLLTGGQIYLNLGNLSTSGHQESATLIERQGAHYVAGQPGARLRLAGTKAEVLAAALESLGCPALAVAAVPQCMPTPFPAAESSMVISAATSPLRCELP